MGRSCQNAATVNNHTVQINAHTNTIRSYGQSITQQSQVQASHGQTLTSHGQSIATIMQYLATHSEWIGGHTSRLDAVEARAGNLEGRAVAVEVRAAAVENNINAILDRLNPRVGDERGPCILLSMQNRLGVLENGAEVIERNVTRVSNRVAEIDDLRERLAQSEAQNVILERRITELEDSMRQWQENVSKFMNAQVRVNSSYEKGLDNLKGRVELQSTNLTDVTRRIDLAVENAAKRESEAAEQMQQQREALNQLSADYLRNLIQNRRGSREFPSTSGAILNN